MFSVEVKDRLMDAVVLNIGHWIALQRSLKNVLTKLLSVRYHENRILEHEWISAGAVTMFVGIKYSQSRQWVSHK